MSAILDKKYNFQARVVKCKCVPKVNILDQNTAFTWYFLRNICMDFGQRFTNRIFLYASILLAQTLLSLSIFILVIFDAISGSWTEGFMMSGLECLALLIILFSMTKSGVELNNLFQTHRELLLRIQTEIRNVWLFNNQQIANGNLLKEHKIV